MSEVIFLSGIAALLVFKFAAWHFAVSAHGEPDLPRLSAQD